MKRELLDPIVSTHLLFVVNSILYATSEYWALSIVLFLSTVCSFLYHIFNETNIFWKRMDHLMCVVALTCIFSNLVIFVEPMQVFVCLGWLVLSLAIYKGGKLNYQIFHTIWHVAVFIGNVLVWYVLTN
jgi:predicted membrane channel-forming protein YqfA (hemolysin III family)